MTAAYYFVDFVIFSFFGWIYECTFCSFKTKHWQNRGFLFGPVCPIYGSGVVLCMIVFGKEPHFAGGQTPLWQVFLICMLGSAVLEFTTSWVLEKFFHALWWDYSDVPLNIQGRICLPASIGFGVAGSLIVHFLLPLLSELERSTDPLMNEVLSLILMFFLASDLSLTVASLTQLLDKMEASEKEFNERMEAGYRIMQQGPDAALSAAIGMAGAAGGKAREKAVAAGEKARERVGAAGEKAIERVGAAGEKAREKVGEAGMKAKEKVAARALAARLDAAAKIRSTGRILSPRERYHLNNISTFRKYKDRALAQRIREKIMRFEGSIGSPLDRTVRRGPDDGEAAIYSEVKGKNEDNAAGRDA